MLEFILLNIERRFLKNTNLTPMKSTLKSQVALQLFELILHQGSQDFFEFKKNDQFCTLEQIHPADAPRGY